MSKFTQVLHLPSASEGLVVAQSIKAVIAKNITASKLSVVAEEDGMVLSIFPHIYCFTNFNFFFLNFFL